VGDRACDGRPGPRPRRPHHRAWRLISSHH
jgi:hypothetical protein